jgi:hypothetical protein
MRFLWKSQLRKERGKFLPPSDEKKKKKREIRSRSTGERLALFGAVLLWILFLGTVVYAGIFSSYLKYTDWQVTGLSVVNEDKVRETVEQVLAEKYLGFIPRDTFFMVQPGALARLLQERYPLLREVTVERTFPHNLTITVAERTTLVLWCSFDVCAHVLENGDTVPVTDVYELEENRSRTIFLEDGSGQPIRLGEKTFEEGFTVQLVLLREQLRERFGIETESRLSFVSRFANEVRMRTTEGWEIYWSTSMSPDASLDAFVLLYDDEIPKERLKDLLYIDLRTENRIFYRYREGEEAEKTVENPASPESTDESSKKKKEKKD